jgi:hypothetical protein
VALFTNDELSLYAGQAVDSDRADLLRILVTGLIQDIDGNDYASDTPTATVRAIALEAAARSVRNPDGVSSKSVSIDDYSVTNRWEGASAAEFGVFLASSEISRLRGVPRARSVLLQIPT